MLALEDLSIYALITTTRLRILVVLRTPAGAAAVSAGGSAGPGTGTVAGASADAKVRDLDVLTVSERHARGRNKQASKQAGTGLQMLTFCARSCERSIRATWPMQATPFSRLGQAQARAQWQGQARAPSPRRSTQPQRALSATPRLRLEQARSGARHSTSGYGPSLAGRGAEAQDIKEEHGKR